MRLARGRDGGWRIAAEVPTFPGPADAVPITADRMIELLDEAGIEKAVVLSDAYWFDSVFQPESADNYDRVRAENDWTAAEAARFPRRLIAFCSFNPLKDYAARELRRCAADGKWRGVKIHLRSSGVDLKRPEHVRKLRSIVAAANQARLPIVIHARGGEDYGADHARVLVDQILPAAPDVVVQIAHLWGGENYSKAALATYADAVAAGHPATRKLYFDVSDAALVANGSSQVLAEIVAAMREIGLDRMVYGSDAPMEGHPPPAASWLAFRQSMPLTEAEFRAIAANVAPYLK